MSSERREEGGAPPVESIADRKPCRRCPQVAAAAPLVADVGEALREDLREALAGDMRKIIGPLSDPAAYDGDPADAFEVIAPSLPGFAFSSPLTSEGMFFNPTADLWVKLMARLGKAGVWAQAKDPVTPQINTQNHVAMREKLG